MLGAGDDRIAQDTRCERMMNAPRERIARVIAPLGAGSEQSRAQRIDRTGAFFIDRALEARANLVRVGRMSVREEPDDCFDERLASAGRR